MTAHVIPIKRQKLAELVAAATRAEALRDMAEWRKAAADVVNLMPAPLLERLAASPRALVIPDDVLWRMPFEALPYKAGLLGDSVRVTYAGSLSALAAPPEARPDVPMKPILEATAPAMGIAVLDRLKTSAPGWTLRAAEEARAEASRVAAGFAEGAPAVVQDEAATEAAFRAQAPSAAWLHVGVPFRVNGASPAFSPLLFADPPRADGQSYSPDDDGVLQAREIMNLDLRARGVVLSDPAALSMRDGAASLPTVSWAWRAAGVPVLIVPRWPIDPAIQHEFLGEAYKRMNAGDAPQAALEAAAAWLRARDGTSAPHAWAAWMIVGR